jgi:hypothetical protein
VKFNTVKFRIQIVHISLSGGYRQPGSSHKISVCCSFVFCKKIECHVNRPCLLWQLTRVGRLLLWRMFSTCQHRRRTFSTPGWLHPSLDVSVKGFRSLNGQIMTLVFYMKLLLAKRTLHVACDLRANWCSFFELCNETAARWSSFWLWFECTHAPLENILSQRGSAKWENILISRLQFRAAHSLDFMSSRLHVFRDVRHSK